MNSVYSCCTFAIHIPTSMCLICVTGRPALSQDEENAVLVWVSLICVSQMSHMCHQQTCSNTQQTSNALSLYDRLTLDKQMISFMPAMTIRQFLWLTIETYFKTQTFKQKAYNLFCSFTWMNIGIWYFVNIFEWQQFGTCILYCQVYDYDGLIVSKMHIPKYKCPFPQDNSDFYFLYIMF